MSIKSIMIPLLGLAIPMIAAAVAEAKNPVVAMETSVGTMKIELYPDKAPVSVKNFIDYVESGFYNGTIFHRVIPGFMIQGGGFEADMSQKSPKAPIKNEAKNGLKNQRGTIAMARTMVVDSATAQFFINVVDNGMLNYQNDRNYGYAVFGKVIEGIEIADKIVSVPTTSKNGHENVPVKAITIKSAKLIK